jgi:nitric oxide dioxygenase
MSLNIKFLESSFSQIKDIQPEFIEQFHVNLLNDYPEAKPLVNIFHTQKERDKFCQSLVSIVNSLCKFDILVNILKELGIYHFKHEILPEHYTMIGNSLSKTFSFYCQEAWTINIQQEWIEAYGAIIKLML